MKYYLGSYYLIKLQKIETNSFIHTCSTCVNDSYLDSWAISWAEDGKNISNDIKSNFSLNNSKISDIQHWTNDKFEKDEIGWINTFSNLATLKDYKSKFFFGGKRL